MTHPNKLPTKGSPLTAQRIAPPPIAPHADWTALVIGDNQAHFAGRNQAPRSYSYVPPGLNYDPVYLLNSCSAQFRGEGTVIVARVPGPYDVAPFATAEYPEQLRQCIQAAGRGGWSATDTAAENGYGWVTFTHHDRPTVHLGIVSHIKIESDQLVDPTDGPRVMAELLAKYQSATGVAWRATAGVTGIQLIRALWDRPVKTPKGVRARKQPLWIEHTDQTMTGAGDILWRRKPSPGPLVVRYDLRMAYGAAAGVAELPSNRLEHTGPCDFDPLVGGYWRIIVPASAWWARNNADQPPVINPGRMLGNRTAWVTTPLLTWLYELDHHPEVIDSWTTDTCGRILRGWYEQLRTARIECADSPRLSAAVKATVNAAVGMMRSGRGRIQRRIWADTIIDLSRANLLRKLTAGHAATGLWPFRVEHDSAWYVVPGPVVGTETDPGPLSAAVGVSPQMGRFRIEDVWPMGEYLAIERAERATIRSRRATR